MTDIDATHTAELTCKTCDVRFRTFLAMNRKQMADYINNLYTQLNADPSVINLTIDCCKHFVKLFDRAPGTYLGNTMTQEQLHQLFTVKFIHAFAVGCNDVDETVRLYTEIVQDVRCPHEVATWALYNTGIQCGRTTEFIRSPKQIPRIIHMIFYGETPLEHHHVRCILSVLEHMCTANKARKPHECYKLFFHTVFETTGKGEGKGEGEGDDGSLSEDPLPKLRNHPDWQRLCSYQNFIVKPIQIPHEIDGYPLQYVQYKADLSRIHVLQRYGGVYLDCDILLVRPFDKLLGQSMENGLPYRFYVCEENESGCGDKVPEGKLVRQANVLNAFLASTPGHPLLDIWLSEFASRVREEEWAFHIRLNEFIWKQNPNSIATMGIKVLTNKPICPYGWQRFEYWTGSCDIPLFDDDIYGVHLWNTISSTNGLLRNILPGAEYAEMVPYTSLAENAVVLSTNEKDADASAVALKRRINAVRVLSRIGYDKEHTHVLINDRHTNPMYGCRSAHIQAIKMAKENNWSSVMIVEDDVELNPRVSPGSCSGASCKRPPLNWDMLYLGGILVHYTELWNTSPVVRLMGAGENVCMADWVRGTTWCNHAYVVRKHLYDAILSAYEKMEVGLLEHQAKVHGASKVNFDDRSLGLCGMVNIDHFYVNMITPSHRLYLAAGQPLIQSPELSAFGPDFDWSTWSLKNLKQPADQLNNWAVNWNELRTK